MRIDSNSGIYNRHELKSQVVDKSSEENGNLRAGSLFPGQTTQPVTNGLEQLTTYAISENNTMYKKPPLISTVDMMF